MPPLWLAQRICGRSLRGLAMASPRPRISPRATSRSERQRTGSQRRAGSGVRRGAERAVNSCGGEAEEHGRALAAGGEDLDAAFEGFAGASHRAEANAAAGRFGDVTARTNAVSE